MHKIYHLTLCALLFALCASAHAQQPKKVARIGYLDASTATGTTVLIEALRQALSKLGWDEGNLAIEYRFADQKNERLPDLAADLVHLNVDLIVVAGAPPTVAAKRASSTIPIVMAFSGDPVALGLVATLARPGGNVTGLSALSAELNTKRLEILKDAVPKLGRVGVLRLPESIGSPQMKELRPAALALKGKTGGDRGSTRRQRVRERGSTCKTQTGQRHHDKR
jgi:putative tryptophan/tyrosine transport system substrate-binding protein